MANEGVLVKDIMSREIVAVEPDATANEALARMEHHRIHEMPVMQNSALKGWLNYDALIRRPHVAPATKVSTLMVTAPRIAQTADVIQAADLMIRQNVRAVSVFDAKGNMVGVLSRTDLMAAAAKLPGIASQSLEKVMTRDLETLPEDAKVDEAAHRLRSLSLRQILVLNKKGRLVGTVGREVILHALASEDRNNNISRGKGGHISSAGRTKDRDVDLKGLVETPVTLPPTATLGEAITQMRKHHKSMVVVLDEGLPIGVVARANILERVAALAVPEGTLVQVIGLQQHADSGLLDQVHALARQGLDKVEKAHKVEFLSLHYKLQHSKNGDGNGPFMVTAHLSTDRDFLVTTNEDFDPLRATSNVLDELERRVFERKELRLARRRGGPKRGAALYRAS